MATMLTILLYFALVAVCNSRTSLIDVSIELSAVYTFNVPTWNLFNKCLGENYFEAPQDVPKGTSIYDIELEECDYSLEISGGGVSGSILVDEVTVLEWGASDYGASGSASFDFVVAEPGLSAVEVFDVTFSVSLYPSEDASWNVYDYCIQDYTLQEFRALDTEEVNITLSACGYFVHVVGPMIYSESIPQSIVVREGGTVLQRWTQSYLGDEDLRIYFEVGGCATDMFECLNGGACIENACTCTSGDFEGVSNFHCKDYDFNHPVNFVFTGASTGEDYCYWNVYSYCQNQLLFDEYQVISSQVLSQTIQLSLGVGCEYDFEIYDERGDGGVGIEVRDLSQSTTLLYISSQSWNIHEFRQFSVVQICPDEGICHNNGTCEEGTCVCIRGFTGELCQGILEQCVSDSSCGHGFCDVDGYCTCEEGWTGVYCNEDLGASVVFIYFDGLVTTADNTIYWYMTCDGVLAASGELLAEYVEWQWIVEMNLSPCVYEFMLQDGIGDGGVGAAFVDEWDSVIVSFSGSSYGDEIRVDVPVTGRCPYYYPCINGTCVDGRCVCEDGWGGTDCSDPMCLQNEECGPNAICAYGVCMCEWGFSGNPCEETPGVIILLDVQYFPYEQYSEWNLYDLDENTYLYPDGNVILNSPGVWVEYLPVEDHTYEVLVKDYLGNGGVSGQVIEEKTNRTLLKWNASDYMFDGAFVFQAVQLCNRDFECAETGTCVNGTCVCDEGYVDWRCSSLSCSDTTCLYGTCANDECQCSTGYIGVNCGILSSVDQVDCPVESGVDCDDSCTPPSRDKHDLVFLIEVDSYFEELAWQLDDSCRNKSSAAYEFESSGRREYSFTLYPGAYAATFHDKYGDGGVFVTIFDLDLNRTLYHETWEKAHSVYDKTMEFTVPWCSSEVQEDRFTCRNGGTCVNGTCVCPENTGGIDCGLTDCSCTHGSCVNFTCVCDEGFSGITCSEGVGMCDVDYSCMHGGLCTDSGGCLCTEGYFGFDCSGECPEEVAYEDRHQVDLVLYSDVSEIRPSFWNIIDICRQDPLFTHMNLASYTGGYRYSMLLQHGYYIAIGTSLAAFEYLTIVDNTAGAVVRTATMEITLPGSSYSSEDMVAAPFTIGAAATCPLLLTCLESYECVEGLCVAAVVQEDVRSCPLDFTCVNGGVCTKEGVCDCPEGFNSTEDCSALACSELSPCLHEGVCVDGTCLCDNYYKGDICDIPQSCVDDFSCLNEGTCDVATGECTCPQGTYGVSCEFGYNCTVSGCSGHGECDQLRGVCACDDLFGGVSCGDEVAAGTAVLVARATCAPAEFCSLRTALESVAAFVSVEILLIDEVYEETYGFRLSGPCNVTLTGAVSTPGITISYGRLFDVVSNNVAFTAMNVNFTTVYSDAYPTLPGTFLFSNFSGVSVRLLGCEVRNFRAVEVDGAALYLANDTTFYAEGCLFYLNLVSPGVVDGISYGGRGGVLFMKDSVDATFIDSTLSLNGASVDGSAVFVAAGSLFVDTCVFERSNFYGVLDATDMLNESLGTITSFGSVVVRNSQFIYLGMVAAVESYSSLVMENCLVDGFLGLHSSVVVYAGMANLRNVEFRNGNSHLYAGGFACATSTIVVVEDSLFYANEGVLGGAMLAEGCEITVINTQFIGNYAQIGAAVYVVPIKLSERTEVHIKDLSAATAIFQNCTFEDNLADSPAALYTEQSITLVASTFRNNHPGAGEAGYDIDLHKSETNSTFVGLVFDGPEDANLQHRASMSEYELEKLYSPEFRISGYEKISSCAIDGVCGEHVLCVDHVSHVDCDCEEGFAHEDDIQECVPQYVAPINIASSTTKSSWQTTSVSPAQVDCSNISNTTECMSLLSSEACLSTICDFSNTSSTYCNLHTGSEPLDDVAHTIVLTWQDVWEEFDVAEYAVLVEATCTHVSETGEISLPDDGDDTFNVLARVAIPGKTKSLELRNAISGLYYRVRLATNYTAVGMSAYSEPLDVHVPYSYPVILPTNILAEGVKPSGARTEIFLFNQGALSLTFTLSMTCPSPNDDAHCTVSSNTADSWDYVSMDCVFSTNGRGANNNTYACVVSFVTNSVFLRTAASDLTVYVSTNPDYARSSWQFCEPSAQNFTTSCSSTYDTCMNAGELCVSVDARDIEGMLLATDNAIFEITSRPLSSSSSSASYSPSTYSSGGALCYDVTSQVIRDEASQSYIATSVLPCDVVYEVEILIFDATTSSFMSIPGTPLLVHVSAGPMDPKVSWVEVSSPAVVGRTLVSVHARDEFGNVQTHAVETNDLEVALTDTTYRSSDGWNATEDALVAPLTHYVADYYELVVRYGGVDVGVSPVLIELQAAEPAYENTNVALCEGEQNEPNVQAGDEADICAVLYDSFFNLATANRTCFQAWRTGEIDFTEMFCGSFPYAQFVFFVAGTYNITVSPEPLISASYLFHSSALPLVVSPSALNTSSSVFVNCDGGGSIHAVIAGEVTTTCVHPVDSFGNPIAFGVGDVALEVADGVMKSIFYEPTYVELVFSTLLTSAGYNTLTVTYRVTGEKMRQTVLALCPPGYYHEEMDFDARAECMECPEGACCLEPGTIPSTMSTQPNYWRETINSTTFFTCFDVGDVDSDCASGELPSCGDCICNGLLVWDGETDQNAQCMEGHAGRLCGSCQAEYRMGLEGCEKCLPKVRNALLIIFVVTVMMVALSLVVYSQVHHATLISRAGVEAENNIVLLKILLSYLQAVSFAKDVPYDWPLSIAGFLDMHSIVVDPSGRTLSMECLFSGGTRRTFFLRVQAMLLLPCLAVAMSTAFYRLIFWYKSRGKGKTLQLDDGGDTELSKVMCDRKKRFRLVAAVTVVVVMFLLHPAVVVQLFRMLRCTTIGGTRYLYSDLDVECYTGEHLYRLYVTFLPGALIYLIAIPSFAIWLLLSNRRRLHEKTFRAKCGFLYRGYKDEYYYWELTVILRKMILAMSAVMLQHTSPALQGLSLSGILAVALVLHAHCRPFKATLHNTLEFLGLTVSFLTNFFGMYFTTSEVREADVLPEVLAISLFTAHAITVLSFVSAFVRKYLVSDRLARTSARSLCHVSRLFERHVANRAVISARRESFVHESESSERECHANALSPAVANDEPCIGSHVPLIPSESVGSAGLSDFAPSDVVRSASPAAARAPAASSEKTASQANFVHSAGLSAGPTPARDGREGVPGQPASSGQVEGRAAPRMTVSPLCATVHPPPLVQRCLAEKPGAPAEAAEARTVLTQSAVVPKQARKVRGRRGARSSPRPVFLGAPVRSPHSLPPVVFNSQLLSPFPSTSTSSVVSQGCTAGLPLTWPGSPQGQPLTQDECALGPSGSLASQQRRPTRSPGKPKKPTWIVSL